MRKQSFYTLGLTLLTAILFQGAQAQNTSPYWSLAGNSNASTTSKLGTTNAIPLRFLTKNSERLRIDTSGNVGIGTTTIGSRLTLNSASGASPLKVQINASTKLYMNSSGGLSVGSGTSAPSNGLYVSGNVGIGIAAPTQKLQVVGTSLFTSTLSVSNGGLSVKNTTGSLGNAALDANGSLYGITSQGGNYGVFASSTSGTGVFGSSTNGKGIQGSGGTYGVYGTSTDIGATGYSAGVYGASGNYGVQGVSDANIGVFGIGYNYGGKFNGNNSNSNSVGVLAVGSVEGVYGTGKTGVYGVGDVNSNGTGVYGTGTYGVQGISDAFTGVYGSGYSYGGEFYASPNNSISIGVYGKGGAKGVQGEGPTGVYGIGTNSGDGVIGQSTSSTYSSNGSAGVYGSGYYGILGQGGTVGIGVYGGGAYGIYGVGTTYAGYFTGNVIATAYLYQSSDRKLKKNITDFTSAMDIIGKLQPKTYEYRQDGNYKLMNLPEGKHYGLIAQDIEKVLPNLVKDSKFDTRLPHQDSAKGKPGTAPAQTASAPPSEVIDFKAVNYTELIPIMVKGMQELNEKNKEIDALKTRIDKLEELVNRLAANQSTNSITLTSAYLEQNTPNPVNGTTIIRYHVPQTSTSAMLNITDAKGQLVKAISLINSGSGQVNVNTSMLASGTYNYTLYVDGKLVDTKRLMIAR